MKWTIEMNAFAKTVILTTTLVGGLLAISSADASSHNAYLRYLKFKYHTTSATLALIRSHQEKALNPQPLPPCGCEIQLNPQPLPPLEINRNTF
jgi:hypothetical protein